VAQGVGAAGSPAHAGAFQTGGDYAFARRLDAAGADRPAVSHTGRVVGAVQVIAEITRQLLAGLLDQSARSAALLVGSICSCGSFANGHRFSNPWNRFVHRPAAARSELRVPLSRASWNSA
jgi:hypothetical protein